MSNPVVKNSHRTTALPILVKSIASSLLLGLVCTVGTTINPQTSTAHFITQARPDASPNVINQRLLGQWQTKVSESGQTLTLVFAPNGNLFIVLPSRAQTATALQLKYRLASTSSSPMHIDLTSSENKTAMTIFDFTPDGKLRMQLQGTDAGKPRPNAFTSTAMVFDKTSNATTLPANARIQTGSPNRVIPR